MGLGQTSQRKLKLLVELKKSNNKLRDLFRNHSHHHRTKKVIFQWTTIDKEVEKKHQKEIYYSEIDSSLHTYLID